MFYRKTLKKFNWLTCGSLVNSRLYRSVIKLYKIDPFWDIFWPWAKQLESYKSKPEKWTKFKEKNWLKDAGQQVYIQMIPRQDQAKKNNFIDRKPSSILAFLYLKYLAALKELNFRHPLKMWDSLQWQTKLKGRCLNWWGKSAVFIHWIGRIICEWQWRIVPAPACVKKKTYKILTTKCWTPAMK